MKRFVFSLLALVALAGCDNLQHQSNPRSLDPSPHFADGTSSRPRPANTVARGEPLNSAPLESGFTAGAPLDHIPIPITRELLTHGRERFNIYCAVCHGEDGYGTGIVVRRGFPTPPSYHDERLRAAADGHLFDVITRGYGVMPLFSDRLDSRDRWAVVAYIRALQLSQHAALSDVPATAKTAFLHP